MRIAPLAVTAVVSLLAVVPASAAAAAPGDLDPSWGGTGYVTTTFPDSDYSFADGMAVKGNDTVAVGGVSTGSVRDFAIARYNKDGSLDRQVTTDFNGGADLAAAAAYMGEKLVVVGYTSPDDVDYNWAIARYNKDLTLDQSFGTGGKVVTDFGPGEDFANAVAIRGDKVVVAGTTETGGGGRNFALARYNKDGSLDTSFDGDGKVVTDFAGATDSAGGVTFVGDKILAGGYAQIGSSFDFALAQYKEKDGSLDPSFDGDGKVTTDFGNGNDFAHAVDVKGDRLLAVGESSNGSDQDFAAAQYDKRGALDPRFDTDGRARLDLGGDDVAFGGAYQDDGLVVMVGATPFGFDDQFAVARFTPAGAPDPNFGGGDGFTTTLIGGDSGAYAMALDGGQKILAAGFSDNDFAVARYIGKKK
jgi:uncharacterized delta-60 repeat protein